MMNLNENKNLPPGIEQKKKELGIPENAEVQVIISENEEPQYRFYIWGERETIGADGKPVIEKVPIVLKTISASEL
jgi:hypothetical protein